MILLSAARIDTGDHFTYRVEPADRQPIVTDDEAAAVALLRDFGVEDPHRLIAHARNWGMVEIVEPEAQH